MQFREASYRAVRTDDEYTFAAVLTFALGMGLLVLFGLGVWFSRDPSSATKVVGGLSLVAGTYYIILRLIRRAAHIEEARRRLRDAADDNDYL